MSADLCSVGVWARDAIWEDYARNPEGCESRSYGGNSPAPDHQAVIMHYITRRYASLAYDSHWIVCSCVHRHLSSLCVALRKEP